MKNSLIFFVSFSQVGTNNIELILTCLVIIIHLSTKLNSNQSINKTNIPALLIPTANLQVLNDYL